MEKQSIHILGKSDGNQDCNGNGAAPTEEYKDSYLALFTAISNTLEALESQNYGIAKNLLIGGQQKAEELFLQAAESEM